MDLQSKFQAKVDYLNSIKDKPSLYQGLPENELNEVNELIARFKAGVIDTDPKAVEKTLQLLHETQRITLIYKAGAENDAKLKEKLDATTDKLWAQNTGLPVDSATQDGIADQMAAALKAGKDDHVLIWAGPTCKKMVETSLKTLLDQGVDTDVNFYDNHWKYTFAANASPEQLKGLTNAEEERLGPPSEAKLASGVKRTQPQANKLLWFREPLNTAGVTDTEGQDINKKDDSTARLAAWANITSYEEGMGAGISEALNNGKMQRVSFTVPTEADAAKEQRKYEDYLKSYCDACNQPWKEIKEAQALLKEKLDKGKEIRITNNDGTDITLQKEGFTFGNNALASEFPGSQLFSAPALKGVKGTVVAKGSFTETGVTDVVENITLRFGVDEKGNPIPGKEGQLTYAKAEIGNDVLQQYLIAGNPKAKKEEAATTEETATTSEWKDDQLKEGNTLMYLGQIAIGTNPGLKRMINLDLAEKAGGGFIFSLGPCFTYKEYGGQPINADNGNHVPEGQDTVQLRVPVMLKGTGGEIRVDGELIQKDGKFLDPKLAVLNDGWAALPENQRPKGWTESPAAVSDKPAAEPKKETSFLEGARNAVAEIAPLLGGSGQPSDHLPAPASSLPKSGQQIR